jgi:hypothetical protein
MADNFKGNAEEFESRIKTTASIVEEALRSIADRVSGIFEEAAAETSNFSKTLERDITRSINNLARTSGILESNQSKLTLGTLKEKDVLKQIETRKDKIKSIETQIGIAVRSNKITQEQGNKLLGEAIDYERELLKDLEEQAKKAKEINQNLGITGQLFDGLSKYLQKFGINSQIINDVKDKLVQAAVKGKVSFGAAFKAISEGATEALKDPAVKFLVSLKLMQSGFNDIKKAFNIFKEFDATFTTIGRSAGFSSGQMAEMTKSAIASQNPLNQNVFSAKQTAQAIADLNNNLGLTVDLGKNTTNEFASMTNSMGLSAEEATKIYKLGRLNNLSLKDTNKAIAAGIVATQRSTGVQINARQIFQDIAKLSAGITVKFNQNPEALAKAAAQARALGTNLETIDKIGESLLNFESSIESQLKAQLITGKAINLEKARYAALTGDQVTLTKEITNQVGSLADFQNMNVIAQKSLAEAFGMSRDEMADMLQKQEVFNKLGDISGKSATEQLAIARQRNLSESDSLVMNLKQQSAAEKIGAAFDNIKTIIADLVSGPFSVFVDLMSFVSRNAFATYTAIALIAGISLTKTIAGIAMMASSLAQAGIFASTTSAALTLGASVLVIGASVAAVLAFMKSASSDAASNVPKYAKGGITTKPHIGMVGEAGPEAIIPLNSPRAKNLFGSNGTEIVDAIKDAITSGFANQRDPQFSLIVDGEPLGTVVGNQYTTSNKMRQNSHSFA